MRTEYDVSIANQPNVYEQAAPARVRTSHGRLIYRTCPRCGHELTYIWRPRDHSHDDYATCRACYWQRWAVDMERDMQRRYGLTQSDIDRLYAQVQLAEEAAETAAAS